MKKIQYRLSNPPPPYQPLSGDVDAVFPTGAIQEKPGLTRRERNELTAVLAEISSRQKEALRLYRPWPIQEAFHASRAPTRLARGSNRAGKTLSTCVELARALTGQDPHGKYPAKGRCIVVGKDLIHCSKVIYRKLFKPGAFKIIRDFGTGEWRSYVPETDQDREDEAQDAPPLISPRYYAQKDMSWEDKREEILRSVRIKTGWEMTFFSGEGQPPQGWDVDLVVFDEEIPHPRWYPEMVPRLVDRGGRFIWSFTPQAGTVVAYELYERAMEEKGSPKPAIEDFLMTILDNPYISQAAKDRFYAELQFNEEELKVRFYGDFALKGMRVFPEFSKTGPHKIKPFDIPDDWTRQVAIDPGRRVAAALLKAIPPPGSPLLDRPVIYREVYCKQSTASRFAQELKMAIGPHHVRDWLIDHQHGRKRTEESGHTTEDIYAEELRKVGLEQQGFKGFIWAASDIAAGKTAAKGALQIVEGAPAWYFMIDQLPWFAWEIERYIDKRETKGGNIVDDISRSNLHNHLMDCFRYLAMHNSRYVKPPRPSSQVGWVNKLLDARRAKKRAGGGWGNSVRLS